MIKLLLKKKALNNKIKYFKLTSYSQNENGTPVSSNDVNRPLGLIKKIMYGCKDLKKQKRLKKNLNQL